MAKKPATSTSTPEPIIEMPTTIIAKPGEVDDVRAILNAAALDTPIVPTAFMRMPEDMQAIAMQAYTDAKAKGMKGGDAVASAMQTVRRWCRENNRRFPD